MPDPRYRDLTPTQQVPTPTGRYSNPVDNMIAAATRLAAIPIEGESPVAIDLNTVELLQTAVA